jgi:hypothetical protein
LPKLDVRVLQSTVEIPGFRREGNATLRFFSGKDLTKGKVALTVSMPRDLSATTQCRLKVANNGAGRISVALALTTTAETIYLQAVTLLIYHHGQSCAAEFLGHPTFR